MIVRRLISTLRLGALILLIGAGLWALQALAVQFRIHLANDWQRHAPIASKLAPLKGDRIIVFAPHCDDETLGCGGLLAMASRNGARASVVLVTNGDGFRIAVARAYNTVRVTPQLCIRFARKRQRETLGALATLGIPRTRVTFLGYPDRGVAGLWDNCWGRNRLYVSHATRWDHSPYDNSFTPNAPYCGESLLADLQAIIKRERPTHLYVPHPCDNHSDHYATYCFVMAALEQLAWEGFEPARNAKVQCYLVHRGDWPCPKGDYPDASLAPPFALARTDTKWRSLELGEELGEVKRRAMRKYGTQTAMERSFLMSFARRNEVFGSMPTRRVASVRRGRIQIDGEAADWSGIPPAVVDPVGDYVVAEFNRGGDVRAIYLASDGKSLFLRTDCARNLSRAVTYQVNLRGLADGGTRGTYAVEIRPASFCRPAKTIWAYSGNTLELAVPLRKLDFDRDVFVQITTKLSRLTVDKTGWRRVEF